MMRNRLAAGYALAIALTPFSYPASADSDTPALPVCRPQHEWRTPVPVWTPALTKDGTLPSAPPERTNGTIFIDVGLDKNAPACETPPSNNLFEFEVPKGTPGAPNGLKVKIADDQMGEDSFHDCIFNGFYAATPRAARPDGMHQGWTETYFAPIDKSRIEATGQYCMARGGVR